MRDCNKPQFVGASIARPSAAAEMQFAFRTECIFFASARPVIMANFFSALAFCFTSLRVFTDGRAMLAPTGAIIKPFCHSENGKIPKTSAEKIGQRSNDNMKRKNDRKKALRASESFFQHSFNFGSIINVGVAKPKGKATPNIFHY